MTDDDEDDDDDDDDGSCFPARQNLVFHNSTW